MDKTRQFLLNLGYTEKGVDAILKFKDATHIKKAMRSTKRYKPGDRNYFRGALKHYADPQKNWKPPHVSPIRMSGDFEEAKKRPDEVIAKILKAPMIYDCKYCGTGLEWHGRMKHQWLEQLSAVEQLSPVPLDMYHNDKLK